MNSVFYFSFPCIHIPQNVKQSLPTWPGFYLPEEVIPRHFAELNELTTHTRFLFFSFSGQGSKW